MPSTPLTPPAEPPDPLAAAGLSLEEFKKHADRELPTDDTVLGSMLKGALVQAADSPPYGCGRLLAPEPSLVDGDDTADPVTKRVRPRGRDTVIVPDAREITKVELDGVEVAWDVDLERHGLIVTIQLPRPGRVCDITGRFGFAGLPENLRIAIYVLATRWVHERDAAYADQVAVQNGQGVQRYYKPLTPTVSMIFHEYALAIGVGGL